MDDTVTKSKSVISEKMRDLLLPLKDSIVIVSGATLSQMRKQVGEGFNLMGCNGNHCHYWSRTLTSGEKKEIISRFHSENIEVGIGGTTCIDFFKKGNSKGDNVLEYIKRKNWKKSECLYVGDALFEGGNDYSVVGKLSTLSVKNPEETYHLIKELKI